MSHIVWSKFVLEGAKEGADIGLVTDVESSRAWASQLIVLSAGSIQPGKAACCLCSETPATASDPSSSRQPGARPPNDQPFA